MPEVDMLDGRMLDRLAMELHASAANRAALENGGYYLPVHVIRRTLELMAAAGVRAKVTNDEPASGTQAQSPTATRAHA